MMMPTMLPRISFVLDVVENPPVLTAGALS